MSQFALSAGTSSAALDALHHAISTARVSLPEDGRVLFLRARDGHWWGEVSRRDWLCQQSFKPFAAALERSGLVVAEPAAGQCFPLVMLLPPRQRDEARAMFARAAQHAEAGATLIASIANDEGARSGEADFRKLFGNAEVLSKHHCRVFWSKLDGQAQDPLLRAEWQALDEPRAIADDRFVSRPGLFAWNRIDPASALLAEHLPADLHGRVADLGAGYGYLACEVLQRCPGVEAIDLYEAEARALEPAQMNIEATLEKIGRPVEASIHWHDVGTGLLARYDAIISNPPFHQGRADQPELGQAFIGAAAKALQADGRLWIVANRHLPYEATLNVHFSHVETIALKQGFKVLHGWGVRR
ncbi:MAG TPA: class I SAM-dependent methyltransferase [Dokdonella sp.]|uniref:class I SAM-dependent methyltransferase n=1 Tax=Dokdonella sp. TaxID=2291710 RepID=UPI002D7E9B6E|nr:class I SAM-dependent methyltransferase [Dokdonella sp.]HET9032294.1 class I SAM-dependent methyltransferase [Dokdonella sp.]